jgi:uncharacterized protein (TIGR02246 family)
MLRLFLFLGFASLLFSQETAVRKVLSDSETAWNRGDLPTFASFYDDSPETTFVGREVTRGGTQAILGRYRRSYPTREKMGVLTFSEIEVRPLGSGYALAIGRFALKRIPKGGGDASGRFTLVLRKTQSGWKIIHDHTS